MAKRITVVVCLVIGLALIANTSCMRCGESVAKKVAEKAFEKSSGGKAKIDIGGNADLSGLPDFLRYPGAKGTSRWTLNAEGKSSTTYILESGDPASTVAAWYKGNLGSWKSSMSLETDKGIMLNYCTEDKSQIVSIIIATSDEGKTTITVTYTTK